MENENNQATEQHQDDTIFSLKRSTARFLLKLLCAVLLGVFVAFVMPPLVGLLSTIPVECWWVGGVGGAVGGTIYACSTYHPGD